MNLLITVCFAAASAGHVRRVTVIQKPVPIVFHSINVDMDKYRPPAREAGLDKLQTVIADLTGAETARLSKDRANLEKVEEEFLESDLHKEALTMKLVPEQ